MRHLLALAILCGLSPAPAQAQEAVVATEPDTALAERVFHAEGPLTVERIEASPPGWRVDGPEGTVGYVGSTWELATSVGYSGRPIDILVGVTPDARIAGAELVRHNEPVLTLGISTEDIAAYVSGFAGVDLTREQVTAFGVRTDLPDVISRATVSTGVIRDAILRTARTLALGRGLVGGHGSIDRVAFAARDWDALAAEGAIAHATFGMDAAREALAGAARPLTGDGDFLDLWVAVLDPPTIGRNLLGQQLYTRALGALAPGDAAILVASRGLHSPRGVDWHRSGVFERIEVIQGAETFALGADDFLRVDFLPAAGAPEMKEMSVFRLPGDRFDATAPFRVEVTATRATADGGEVAMTMPLDYQLPAAFLLPPALPEAAPLWVSAWQAKRASIAGVGGMLAALAGILFFQESFVRRPRLWLWGRTAFLTVTLVWLGWIAGGQLSVVQVVAFLQSLVNGFRWETFLIEPVIFLLWGFVALGLLFWGRGVFCGWLCPFGALQELTNALAQRLGVRQVSVPFAVHERLWIIKYTLFLAILALSFYSMERALVLAEVEPFKTAISMRFMRAWPFVAFVAALLTAGLFIERFFCRYLCPLGAALAIPAKIKLFDWLRRRPQCGRECRLCEVKCPVGAIDPVGRINPNECVLCLRCQVIYHDPATCTVLKARATRRRPEPAAVPA
ncbi:MAG TPA: 4Fe-4S binding protein [Amaricoccus sp.]|nr:4Fe-4S binding protein [Amaricoccus sp.]